MSAPASARGGARVELAHVAILVVALAVVVAAMSEMSPHFLSSRNLFNASRFMAEIGLISLGMAVVVMSGGIDLSVGSVMALAGVAMGLLVAAGVPPPLAAPLTLLVGAAAGAVNGLVITRVGLPPIIVTLATLAVFRGVALGISGGAAFPVGDEFAWLGQGFVAGLPVQTVVLAVVAAVVAFMLRRSTWGRTIFAVGANEIAARYAGLDVARAKLSAYVLSGTLAAAAALIFVSRVSSAKANAGMGWELDAITVVVLAGIPIAGGRGSILCVVLGLVTIGLLRNGMTLAFVQSDLQSVFVGCLLIAAVVVNRLVDWLPFFSSGPRRAQNPAPVGSTKNAA